MAEPIRMLGRHVPSSHPLLTVSVQDGTDALLEAERMLEWERGLDRLALLIRQLPDEPMTEKHRDLLDVLAMELFRRSEL